MRFPCEIQGFNLLKNGAKIQLFVNEEDKEMVMKHIAKFINRPVTMEILVDSEKVLENMEQITEAQRKKIYALLSDFGKEYGDTQANVKEALKQSAKDQIGLSIGSLSDCTKEEAKAFIDYIVSTAKSLGYEFAFLEDQDDALAYKMANNLCFVCGAPGTASATSKGKVCLCPKHIEEGKKLGADKFFEKYHLEGIK